MPRPAVVLDATRTPCGMQMVDLNTLVMFATVVEANSFSEGARRLKLPLSTVSRRVADLERQLGVRLLERSTRKLRLTAFGSELLEHARRGAELSDAIASLVSYQTTAVTGTLRLSAPSSISDSLLCPIAARFQKLYPDVRVQIIMTERMVDHIGDGVDLGFRLGASKDSTLVAKKLLTYRNRLVASPEYLGKVTPPQSPSDLLEHHLLAFSQLRPESTWTFIRNDDSDKLAIDVQPYLSMNDYGGLAAALLAGAGIGELPPIVRPELLRDGRLVEVMPQWKFRAFNLYLLQLNNRFPTKLVSLFKRLAGEMAPKLFPDLPT
jgi:DNA-binding transcriptional LysR family regulator